MRGRGVHRRWAFHRKNVLKAAERGVLTPWRLGARSRVTRWKELALQFVAARLLDWTGVGGTEKPFRTD